MQSRQVHTAAVSSPAACEEQDCTAVNAPRTLLAALRAHAPNARLVHLSTDQVFDGTGHLLAEDATPGPASPTARNLPPGSLASTILIEVLILYDLIAQNWHLCSWHWAMTSRAVALVSAPR